jgi:hypothetical protein
MRLSHTSTLEKVSDILSLGQEQLICRMTHSNPEEDMKIAKVSHSKLTVYPGKELLKKRHG